MGEARCCAGRAWEFFCMSYGCASTKAVVVFYFLFFKFFNLLRITKGWHEENYPKIAQTKASIFCRDSLLYWVEWRKSNNQIFQGAKYLILHLSRTIWNLYSLPHTLCYQLKFITILGRIHPTSIRCLAWTRGIPRYNYIAIWAWLPAFHSWGLLIRNRLGTEFVWNRLVRFRKNWNRSPILVQRLILDVTLIYGTFIFLNYCVAARNTRF